MGQPLPVYPSERTWQDPPDKSFSVSPISGPVDPLLTAVFHPFIGTDRRRQPNVTLRARAIELFPETRSRLFDNLTIQAGVLASGITPRYINGHAAFLHVPPSRPVLKQRTRSSDCTREIFDCDRLKLDSRCGASGNLRFVDINDGIGQPTDTGNNGNCSVPQGAKLRKSAGLEPRRHDQRIDASLNLVSQILVITDRRADLMRVGSVAALYCL